MTHKTLLISTGGTIAGQVAEDRLAPEYKQKQAEAFGELSKPIIDQIGREMNVKLEIDTDEYVEVDSSDITPEHWQGLIDRIVERYDDYDSFVITHGTNTLGYTCAALSFAFENLGKPVVLTGSQVPIQMLGSDAQTNLENALRLATWPRHELKGVMAVFGSHIMTGTRVKKSTEFDYDAFRTFGTNSLGRIGRIVDFDMPNLVKHKGYMEKHIHGHAMNSGTLDVYNKFQTRILSFTEFPGWDPEILRTVVIQNQIKGIIVRAFGAGDMSNNHHEVLKEFKSKEIPVVMTTQAPKGNANLQVNEPGKEIRNAKLAIPAYDMSIETQTAKLMWLLAKKEDGLINYEQLCREMINDIRGEVKVIHEQKFGQ